MNKLKQRKEELEKMLSDKNHYFKGFSLYECQAELNGINLGLEALSNRNQEILDKLKKEFENWECMDGWYNESERIKILRKTEKQLKEEGEGK